MNVMIMFTGQLVRWGRVASCSSRRLRAEVRGMLGYMFATSKETRTWVSGMMWKERACLRWRESWTWNWVLMVMGVRMWARSLEMGAVLA